MQNHVVRWHEVIQRTGFAIAIDALFGVRVMVVIKDLHLKADGGASFRWQRFGHKIFDATITAFADLPFERKLKVLELIGGD